MGKWEMVRLGDVCEIMDNMRVPITASERKSGPYPYYGANGILDYVHDYIFDDELVLLAEDGGNFGSKDKPIAYRVSGKCWVNNHAHVLKPKDMLNVDYLCYSIMFYDVMPLISGTTRAKLNQAAVRKMVIPLPPLPVQRKIADVLDRASALIEKRKAQTEKLDLLIKSQFIEMFGDPVTNPKGWDVGTIRDLVVDVKYGTSKPAEADGKYIYLRMNNITYDGSLDLSDIKHINVDEKEYEKYVVCKGDVLFNRTNSKELVGKTAVFKEDTPMIIAGYIIRVRTNEKACPEYISAFLNSSYGKGLLYNMCKAIVGQANINAQELQNIKIFITPVSLQKEFAAFVERVEEQKKLLQQSLSKLELNYKSLMQKCFRGEIF